MMRNNRRNLKFTPDATGLVLRADNIGGGGGAAAAAAEALSTVSSKTGNGSVQMRAPKTIDAAVLAAMAAEAAAAAPGAITGRAATNRRDVEAWAAQSAAATAAAAAGKEKEDPKAPRLSYVGSVASVSPSESVSMKHVSLVFFSRGEGASQRLIFWLMAIHRFLILGIKWLQKVVFSSVKHHGVTCPFYNHLRKSHKRKKYPNFKNDDLKFFF